MKKMVLLLVVVLILAAGLSPWVAGMQAERGYQDLLARLQEQGLVIRHSEYERGWLESRARAEVVIPTTRAGGADEIAFSLRNRIEHGPLLLEALEQGRIESLQALIRTELVVDDEPLFPQDYPLTFETRMPLSGDAHTRIALAPFRTRAGAGIPGIEFRGLSGDLRFDPALEHLSVRLSMPYLEVNGADGGTLKIESVSVISESRRSIAGLMLGEGQLKIEAIEIRGEGSTPGGGLRRLNMTVDSGVRSEQVYLHARYAVESVRLSDGDSYGPMELGLGVERLPAAALAQIQAGMESLRDPGLSEEQRLGGINRLFGAHLGELMRHNPRFSLDPLRVETPDGRIEGDLVVELEGAVAKDLQQPGVLWQKIAATGRVRIPEPLLRGMIERWARTRFEAILAAQDGDGQGLADPEELDRQAAAMAEQQLAMLVQQQLVVRDGGDIVTVARLGGGLLTVNGKTVAMPQLTGP